MDTIKDKDVQWL